MAHHELLYQSQKHHYKVFSDQETGEHLIEIVCHGTIVTGLRVRMTPEEVEQFRGDPDSLRDLNDRHRFDPLGLEARRHRRLEQITGSP